MRNRTRVALVAAIAAGLLAAGCTEDGDRFTARGGGTPPAAVGAAADAAPVSAESLGIDLTTQDRCDPLDAGCLLPFPSDHFTVADAATPTGRRVRLVAESMPANVKGVHMDPTDWNLNDGFSPGSPILFDLAGVDLTASKAPSLVDPATSLADDSPIVVLDATTEQRHPVWVELDAQADAGVAPRVMVHPAVQFPEGHRMVVAVRWMVAAGGTAIEPSPAFAAYRDGQRTTDVTFEARRADMESDFGALAAAGVTRSNLQLAWSFTVASRENTTGRMVAMRDDAFAQLGDAAPTFSVTKVTQRPKDRVYRQVDGTFELPNYLTGTGEPGSRLVLDAAGKPVRQASTFTADFRCMVPESAVNSGKGPAKPARMSLYGHGLLGSRDEVGSSLVRDIADEYDIVYCGTDFYGMAEDDVGNAAAALGEMSTFGSVPDRIQQGLLAFLFLGRLMQHPAGFTADPAFDFGGTSVLDTSQLFYDGNSQGAILGGALTAVAQDFTRSVLGEAGMNYALLLDRSVDFDEYLTLAFRPAYPARNDRMMAIALAGMLWDRGEADGYSQHMTDDPLPGTPAHTVLLLGAVGDHQVTEYSLRVEAATIGARAHVPVAKDGRTVHTDPSWGLPTLTGGDGDPSRKGSAYVLSDTGSPSSPLANLAPRDGHDPHDDTPNIPEIQRLKDAFMRPDGRAIDVCGGAACVFPIPEANKD